MDFLLSSSPAATFRYQDGTEAGDGLATAQTKGNQVPVDCDATDLRVVAGLGSGAFITKNAKSMTYP